jgi:hypothetical protein
MINKFGDLRVPYEKTIQLENISGGVDGAGVQDANEFSYCYSRRTSSGVNETERLPQRNFKVLNPHLYDGALGLQNAKTFNNTDSIFIVNSQVNKADGNFLANRFFIKTIGETGVSLGSHPMDGGDVQRVFDERCTAVLNLQTQMGLSQRQINPGDISNMFYSRGITTYARYQVADSF